MIHEEVINILSEAAQTLTPAIIVEGVSRTYDGSCYLVEFRDSVGKRWFVYWFRVAPHWRHCDDAETGYGSLREALGARIEQHAVDLERAARQAVQALDAFHGRASTPPQDPLTQAVRQAALRGSPPQVRDESGRTVTWAQFYTMLLQDDADSRQLREHIYLAAAQQVLLRRDIKVVP